MPAVHIVAALALVVAAVSLAFNLFAYTAAAAARRRAADCSAEEDERPAWARRVQAFAFECVATTVLAWTTPLAVHRRRLRPFDARRQRPPVVLLHGYVQHSANFLWLARRLRRDGWVHLYEVAHVPLGGDIERSGVRLAGVIERIRRETGAPEVDIVAHSMGGLVARAALGAGAAGIRRIVTLGTPHQGTEAFRPLGLDPMLRQMRPGSPCLRRLAGRHGLPAGTEIISIYSRDDALVVPPSNGNCPGAFNIEVRGPGHMSLLFSRRVYELVRENLAAEVEPARQIS